jgi:heat shock protein HtpX
MINTLKTTLLLSLLTVLLLFMGSAVGGKSGMLIAFFMAAAMNFGSYWFSNKIVLMMYTAQKITRDILISSIAAAFRLETLAIRSVGILP